MQYAKICFGLLFLVSYYGIVTPRVFTRSSLSEQELRGVRGYYTDENPCDLYFLFTACQNGDGAAPGFMCVSMPTHVIGPDGTSYLQYACEGNCSGTECNGENYVKKSFMTNGLGVTDNFRVLAATCGLVVNAVPDSCAGYEGDDGELVCICTPALTLITCAVNAETPNPPQNCDPSDYALWDLRSLLRGILAGL